MHTATEKIFTGIALSTVAGYAGAQESLAVSGPADWMLLVCGLVIGVVIVVRRLNAVRE